MPGLPLPGETGGNGRGTLKSATDGNNHTTTYGYDQYGNLLTVTPPAPVGPETLQVDGVSRVISVTDGNNLTTLYTYDALDRVTNIQYNNGSGSSILYDFDNNGNQTSVVDNTGTTTLLYDADNRILKKTLPGGQVLASTYDGVGNLLSYSDAGGKVSDTYTKVNLIETITEPHDTNATTFTYYNNNQSQTQTYPNGVVTTWQYDKANRITSDVAATGNGTVLFNESDSYLTISGNKPTELLQTRTNNLEQDQTRYRYDTMNRLTDAPVFNSGNVEVDDYEYRFDKAGNWVSSAIHLNATPTTYQYNADNELTSKTQGSSTVTYSYDGTGNLLSFTGGPTAAYNAKNQTKSIGSDNYTYSGASQTERVQVNGTSFVYSGLGLSSQKDSSGTTYYTRCSCGLLIDERQPDGSKHYYITNSLGSIVGLTDQAGTTLVNTYDYDPTGNILSETEGVSNVWKYAGGYFNEINGTVLYKFGTRYYDPEVGRWTQQDPVAGSVGKADSLNRYVYAGDDPVNEVDPSGAVCFPNGFAFLAAVSAILLVLLPVLTAFIDPLTPVLVTTLLTVNFGQALAALGFIIGTIGAIDAYVATINPGSLCIG